MEGICTSNADAEPNANDSFGSKADTCAPVQTPLGAFSWELLGEPQEDTAARLQDGSRAVRECYLGIEMVRAVATMLECPVNSSS